MQYSPLSQLEKLSVFDSQIDDNKRLSVGLPNEKCKHIRHDECGVSSVIAPFHYSSLFSSHAKVCMDSLMTLPTTSVRAKMQHKFDLSKLKAYGWRPFWMRIKWAYIIDFVLLLLPNHN